MIEYLILIGAGGHRSAKKLSVLYLGECNCAEVGYKKREKKIVIRLRP
jgi:hypothetical protein